MVSWHKSAVLFLFLLTGCGVVGEPLPPLLEIPLAVKDLTAVQVGAHLRLTWSQPRLTTEGTPARRLDRMELYGIFLPPGESLAKVNFAEFKLLDTVRPGEVPLQQGQVTCEIPLTAAQVHQRAFFAIRALNDKGKNAGYSNVSSLDIVDLPEPPTDLQATATEKAIQLRWKPATVSAFGGPAPTPDGYRLYRGEAGSLAPPQEIGTSQTTTYDDTAFAFGATYIYTVRAFVGRAESAALTPPSPPVEIAAKDIFPPAAPRNVRAIAVPGAIEIAWSPNSESDLAGYDVYRSAEEQASFTKLNTELLIIPVFRDAGVTASRRYIYHVTAVDKSGNESAPSEDVPVAAE